MAADPMRPLKRQRLLALNTALDSPRDLVEKLYNLFEIDKTHFRKFIKESNALFDLIEFREKSLDPTSFKQNDKENILSRGYAVAGSTNLNKKICRIFRWVLQGFPDLIRETKKVQIPETAYVVKVDVFHYACLNHQVDLFDPTREDFNRAAECGITGFGFLFLSMTKNNIHRIFIEQALKLGINPNNRHLGSNTLSLLHRAVLCYDTKVVQLLLHYGHRLDVVYNSSCPIPGVHICMPHKPMDLIEGFGQGDYRKIFGEKPARRFLEEECKKSLDDIAFLFIGNGERLSKTFLKTRVSPHRFLRNHVDRIVRVRDIVWKQQVARESLLDIFNSVKIGGIIEIALNYLYCPTT